MLRKRGTFELPSFKPTKPITPNWFLTPLGSYETTPKWHGFLMINLVALAAGARAEKRTAESLFDWVLQLTSALSVQRSGVQYR